MTPAEAAKLLELPDGASPDDIQARFLDLRAKLEEKIGRAPTPGLKEKYRVSLAEVTEAFEALTLAADSSTLPLLKKTTVASQPQPAAPVATPTPARRPKKSSNKEFVVVALVAAFVLVIGGWWVISTRAENERKARAAAAAKVAAERDAALEKQLEEEKRQKLAAAEKNEKARLDALLLRLRSRMVELNLAYEALLRTEQNANRELSDLRAQQSDLRDAKTAAAIEARNKVKAQEMYVRWLGDYLPGNPAQVAKTRAEAALSDRSESAAELVDAYAAAVAALKVELKESQCDPLIVAAIDGQRRMADQGDATAMNWLSHIYFDGDGVPRDEALGVQWALKAAARGDIPRAQQRLGEAYRLGRGVAKDPAAAFSWYRKAAEQGDATGYFYVAYAYQDGEGVAQDLAAAIPWYEKSAATGELAAMTNLAVIYFEQRNPTQAVEWLKKAADLKGAHALAMLGQVNLGLLYPKAGLPLDEAAGIEYLRQAARLNDAPAQEILKSRSLTW